MKAGKCRGRVTLPMLEAWARARAGSPGLLRSRRLGGGVEFAELRDYVPGDEPRWIDWRASARRPDPATLLRLVVRRFVTEERLRLLVTVPVQGSLLAWDKLETISYALGAVYAAAKSLGDEPLTLAITPWGASLHHGPVEAQLHAAAGELCRLLEEGEDAGDRVDWPLEASRILAARRPDMLAAVGDYNVEPGGLRRLAQAASAAGVAQLYLLATSPPEHRAPPGLEAAPVVAAWSGAATTLAALLGEAEKHMARIHAVLRARGALVERVDGLAAARLTLYRLLHAYVTARSMAPATTAAAMAGW